MVAVKAPEFLFDIAAYANCKVYLVGGAVRDLLLGHPVVDFDLLVEGCSALSMAAELSAQGLIDIVSSHEDFGTVKVKWLQNGQVLDIATCRRETYAQPGSLPMVDYPVSICDDLKRRDFSINAISIQLSSSGEGCLVDPFDGICDVERKTIRVLHENSYYEDPTRIIRAVRFAIRFGFEICSKDLTLIAKVLSEKETFNNIVHRIRGIRFGIELERLLGLSEWWNGLKYLRLIGAWSMYSTECSLDLMRDIQLDSWCYRLFWCLRHNSVESIIRLFQSLGITKDVIKNIINVTKLLSPDITLNNAKLFQSLPLDCQRIVQESNLLNQKLFSDMVQAIPKDKPQSLIDKGFRGKEIQDELERIFQINLQKIRIN